MDTIIIAVSPVPRLRSGRHSPRSIAADPTPPKMNASDGCEDQVDAEDGVEEVGDEGAEHDLLGQREVDEAGGAEDQRQSDRAQPDDQAEDDPLVQQASATGEDPVTLLVPGGSGGITLGQVEEDPRDLAGPCFDRQLLLVGPHEFDAGWERVDVQLDDVLAGSGEIDGHEPGRIRGAPTDLVTDGLDDPIDDDGVVHDDLGVGDGILLTAVLGRREEGGLDRLP